MLCSILASLDPCASFYETKFELIIWWCGGTLYCLPFVQQCSFKLIFFKQLILCFFLNFHRGRNPHLNLYSVAHEALQPITNRFKWTRVTRRNWSRAKTKTTHTNTQKREKEGRWLWEIPQRQLPNEKSHQEAAKPSRPKPEEHDKAGGTYQNREHRRRNRQPRSIESKQGHRANDGV
jgi:hypothetical protein